MSTKSDVVNLIMRVNGDQAKKEFQALNAEAAQLKSELKDMSKVNETWKQMNTELSGLEVKYKQLIAQQNIYKLGTEEWKKLQKEISDVSGRMVDLKTQMKDVGKYQQEYIDKSNRLKEVEGRIDSMRAKIDLSSLSIKDLRKEINRLKFLKDTLNPTSEEFKKLSGEIQVAEKRMLQLTRGGTALSRTFDFLKKEALGFGVVMLGALGIDYVIGKIGNLIQKNAELSDSFADIRKTTGMSQKGVEDLYKQLSAIDTRTAKKDLMDIAIGLGQIGEPATVEAIRNIDQIVVALGDEFGKGANEITTELSILRNNFDEFKGGNYGEDMLKIGNALNYMGATGIATAPVVTEFTTRMSGVLNQFGVGAGKTLGLSAAMQELGINVERGSTAVTRLVQKMSLAPEAFAKVAGAKTKEEIAEFVQLINTDVVAALMKVAEGAKTAGQSNTEFAGILKELETEGAGVGEVLSKFAANQELVTQRMNDGAKAITETGSITDEFALKNENLAAKVEKLQKRIASWFTSEAFNNFVKRAVDGTIRLVDSLERAGRWLQNNAIYIKALIAAYATYMVATGRVIAMKTIEIALDRAGYAWLGLKIKATAAYTLVKQLLTRQITLATVAQAAFNAVANLNPLIGLATIIVGVTTALTGYIRKMQEARFEQEKMLSADLLEAEMKKRADTFKAENAAIIQDIKTGNKEKLKLDLEALQSAETIRQEEIKQLKAAVVEKERIAKEETRIANAAGVKGTVKKTDKEREKDAAVLEDAKKNLQDALDMQDNYVKLRQQVSGKLEEIDTQQIEKQKELTEKEKQELEKRKEQYSKFLMDLERLRQSANKARIEVIQEELDRELKLLEFERSQKNKAINDERDRLVKEAVQLKQGKAVIEQIHADSFAQIVANNEQFYKASADLREKYEKELKEEAYQRDIKNLNDAQAAQRLFYSQLYAQGKIDKSTFDQNISDLDKSGKQQLLDIAKQYGIDVVKVQQDITNDEIKVLQDAIERKKRLQQRQADFAVQVAEYEYGAGNGSIGDIFKAKYEQLSVALQNELELAKGHEEELTQIREEYNLKRLQLDEEFRQAGREQTQEYIDASVNLFNEMSSQIFAFRDQKLQEELNAVQNKIARENEAVDRDYKNRLLSDVDYQNKKRANEQKLEREEREAKRKMAVNQKIAAMFTIGLNTAMAIMNAMATNPFPLSVIIASMAGAMGAVQLGFAAAQKVPQYYDGGYAKVQGAQDGRTYTAKKMPDFQNGYLSNPALVLAGERGEEYFVNNTALQNPDVKYVVDGIEQLTRGKINSIDFRQMLAMPALQQRYTGGYIGQTSTTTAASGGSGSGDGNMISMMYTLMSKLSQQLDGGIQATAVIPDKTITDFKARENYLNSIEEDAN